MQIALVSLEVAGFRGGETGTYVVEAGHALTSAGHDVTLITSAPRRTGERETLRAMAEFTRVVFVEEAKVPEGPVRFAYAKDTLRFSYLAFLALTEQVATTHAGVDFDYIEFADREAAGYVSVLEHRLMGTFPRSVLAVALHSPTYERWQYGEALHDLPPGARELMVLEDATVRAAGTLWSPATRTAEIVSERLGTTGPGDDGTRIIRLPMRIPPEPESRPRRVGKLSELRFLFIGPIEPRGGVRPLVEAFARMPDLRIELVGADLETSPFGTSETEWLRRHRAENVVFRGPLPRDQMLAALRSADVVILPSPWASWPTTCIESMAAARVVIGGRHGGMGEMIEHGSSGFVCDGADADDIVRVVQDDLAAALDRLDAIGAAAHERIRELSEPARYVAAIERLIAERRPPACASPTPRDPANRRECVSVIVPFYNEPLEIVGEAISSAIAQSWPSLEILVVEDGSPRADAEAILADLAGRDPRVRVLRKENGGLASARNFALEQARGEYFLFLDADNCLRPGYAAEALEVFRRDEKVDVVVPWFRAFGPSPRAGTTTAPLPFDLSLALVRNSFGDAGAMFRSRVFRESQLRYDPLVDAYSDWALWMDCARAGLRVQQLPRVLYDYRVRKGSMMEEQSWDRHLYLLGLLIQRHLPIGDPATRAMLVTLTRAWGVGALLSALGGRPEYADRGHELAEGFRPGRARYLIADAVAKTVGLVPGIRPLVRGLFRRLSGAHGRFKDRRRGH